MSGGTLVEKLRLDRHVALVTGGAGGMGQAIAKELIGLGAIVVLADRDEAETARAAATLGAAEGIAFDVSSSDATEAAMARIVARHGRLDLLVANAGISYEDDSLNAGDEHWRRVMAINLDGVFYSVRTAARRMASQGAGAIVAISSIAGVTAVRPEVHIGYDVTKAGVVHLCRNLAVEWAPKNIRINAVGPGYTATPMLKDVGEANPAVLRQWLDDVPMHRLMQPEEVARAVAFLLSDAASGITGHNLMVDGGYAVS